MYVCMNIYKFYIYFVKNSFGTCRIRSIPVDENQLGAQQFYSRLIMSLLLECSEIDRSANCIRC